MMRAMQDSNSTKPLKKIAAITMARNDDFFLTRWIGYYGRELGEENIFIYLDGEDQPIPNNAGKSNVIHEKRVVEHVISAEKRRLGFLSTVAKSLLEQYDIIIGVDADEFLVVDPKLGKSLREYLSEIEINPSVSGLGMDVGQHLDLEKTPRQECSIFDSAVLCLPVLPLHKALRHFAASQLGFWVPSGKKAAISKLIQISTFFILVRWITR
jgi:hypothetical protein